MLERWSANSGMPATIREKSVSLENSAVDRIPPQQVRSIIGTFHNDYIKSTLGPENFSKESRAPSQQAKPGSCTLQGNQENSCIKESIDPAWSAFKLGGHPSAAPLERPGHKESNEVATRKFAAASQARPITSLGQPQELKPAWPRTGPARPTSPPAAGEPRATGAKKQIARDKQAEHVKTPMATLPASAHVPDKKAALDDASQKDTSAAIRLPSVQDVDGGVGSAPVSFTLRIPQSEKQSEKSAAVQRSTKSDQLSTSVTFTLGAVQPLRPQDLDSGPHADTAVSKGSANGYCFARSKYYGLGSRVSYSEDGGYKIYPIALHSNPAPNASCGFTLSPPNASTCLGNCDWRFGMHINTQVGQYNGNTTLYPTGIQIAYSREPVDAANLVPRGWIGPFVKGKVQDLPEPIKELADKAGKSAGLRLAYEIFLAR